MPSARHIISIQAGAVSNKGLRLKNVQHEISGSGLTADKGQRSKRLLQSSTIRSFNIDVTFVNSINLAEGTEVEITFDGSSGPVGTFTVTAPAAGETEFFEFCLDAAGEDSIKTGSDTDDTVLIVVSSIIVLL